MYWIIGLLGLALLIAPFALDYTTDTVAMWTNIIIGVITLLAAGFEATAKGRENWEYALAGVAGIVLVAAPFVLNFTTLAAAVWTTVVIGVVMVIIAGIQLAANQPTTR